MHMKIKLGFFVCGTAAAVLMCADVALGGVREQCAGVWKGGASGLAKETYLVLRADGTGAAFGVSERGEQYKAYEFEFESAGDALKLKNRWAMRRSTPGLPVHHYLPEFTQTHVHRVCDAIQPSHPLSSPSPPVPNPSQHHSLFQ